ncbi:unnamed protein product [Adineta steineri]|uniref:Uncharacterized protein n=1 Tax=Adineta steineri TaxID=433720 RepID=A0A813TWP9_9BILA|nr:unnamed protein product [Adineta steineri]CAF3675471.1 unnamed protein product [Adineta steineri]
MLLAIIIIFINYFPNSLSAVELHIHKSVTEIRENYKGHGNIYNHLFSNSEYENIIDGSISWNGTSFIKQELYNTDDTLKDAFVIVKQLSACDCKIIQAKIIDPQTMLLENLETGTYFYADKHSIEYKYKRPSKSGVTLAFHFHNTKTNYNGTLAYLIKGITWLPNYDLSITNFDTCSLRGYAVIRNNQQQEYEVNNTYLYSGDIQLVKNPSLTIYPRYNSSSDSIEFNNEEKGFYSYSFKVPYTLRSLSSVRLPFINITPQCQFHYKAITSIHTGQYKGVFQRYYDLISNQFLPAGILTIRDNQVLIGQSNLPDLPENYTHTITLGQDSDIRYSIKSNLISSNEVQTTDKSRPYSLDITISNFKNKEITGQLDFHGTSHISLSESTCMSGKIDGNAYILLLKLQQGEIYRCQFNVILK